MSKSSLRATLAAIAIGAGVVLCASSAQAVTWVWNLIPNPNTSPGNSETVLSAPGNIPITLAGFTDNTFTTPTARFEKSAGAGEIGLGSTNDSSSENEITGANVIRLDFHNVINSPLGVSSFTFQMGSTTGGENWAIFGSNSATTGYTLITTGLNDESPHTLTGANLFDFYYFALASGAQPPGANVLLGSPLKAVSGVPEPGTWAMMLLGFLGLGFAFRQSRRKVSMA
jgi:PEP-CTERM motif